MPLKEKYSELITAAYAAGVVNLQVQEQKGTLYINGIAPSEKAKQKLLELFEQLNTNHHPGYVTMDIKVDEVTE